MNNNKKNNFCNNCGKLGHIFHQCKIPITSIGIIAIRKNNENIEILIARRKDSLAFVDFMRGKYNLEDKEYIISLFNRMSNYERTFIMNSSFEILWNHLWGLNITNLYKNEEKISRIKFLTLKSGYILNSENVNSENVNSENVNSENVNSENVNLENVNLENIISQCTNEYDEPEWGFPKGRRNYQERDIMCGIREFEEETGYDKSQLINFTNVIPLEEIFTGSNYKSYKHKYFLAYINLDEEPKKDFQRSEISKIEWVNINNVKNYFRDYNTEKKNLINELNNLLKTNKLYI